LVSSLVQEQLNRLPHSPGVYLMRDAGRVILYVGKAIDLHSRVRSYFAASSQLPEKTARLAARVADIDYFVAASEQEALILENNLIKQHHPRFNVRLKDDKTFPYLKIDLGEEWPTVSITRRMEPGGARYFGPFASPRSVKQTSKHPEHLSGAVCTKAIKGKPVRRAWNITGR
jgi:excinuclease ABC subunit C